jgi:hypothetical protein
MATTLKFLPGSTIRWRATRFIVVDYADIDAIIARELGKRKLERIPVRDATQIGPLATRRRGRRKTSSRAERIRLARRKLR